MRRPTRTAILGLRIKELRAEKGISQEELAERALIFRMYMSRIETGVGVANPTFTVLLDLADGLGGRAG